MAQENDVVCPTCKAMVAMRINRTGFLQQKVLWHLGIYPWKCGACGSMFLRRSRSNERDSSQGGLGTDQQHR